MPIAARNVDDANRRLDERLDRRRRRRKREHRRHTKLPARSGAERVNCAACAK